LQEKEQRKGPLTTDEIAAAQNRGWKSRRKMKKLIALSR
jgi:hypothetical protein